MSREAPDSTRRKPIAGALMLALLAACGRHPPTHPAAVAPTSAAQAPWRRASETLPATGSESLSYSVRIDAALSRIDVEICPRGFRIGRMNAPSPNAQELLVAGHFITPEADISCPDESVDLPQTQGDECLRYGVILPDKSPDPTALRRVGADLLASPDLWLWVPTPRPSHLRMRVHFDLPPGVAVVLPWASAGSAGDFELSETSFAWKSAGAFSHSPDLSLASAALRLSVLGEGFEHAGEVQNWIEQGARSSSLLFGHFPVPQALVIAVPGDRSGPAFGMALRGGGPAVVVFLDRHASSASLAKDWTCSHEFLHLGVPRLPPEDAWLFEGLATYYTEVTRARAGIISSARAYQNLLDGFARGRKNADASTGTLRQESAEMRARHSFFRVYWAGAAIALMTDVAARRAHGPTLDAALRTFADCCASSEEDWDAARALSRLDDSLGAPRFSNAARAWLDRREFPAVESVLRALGIAAGRRGEAVFGAAPDAAIRDAIMAPEPSHASAHREPQEPQH